MVVPAIARLPAAWRFVEKASIARRDGRTELQVLLNFLRAGATLVVSGIDHLARSLKDL